MTDTIITNIAEFVESTKELVSTYADGYNKILAAYTSAVSNNEELIKEILALKIENAALKSRCLAA